MNTKHTPGPWQHGINSTNNPGQLPNTFERIYMPGNACAFVTGENSEANAALIAAAPDLLEIVKALYDWYKAAPNGPGPSPAAQLFEDDDSLDTHIQRAIAAAEGKV